MEEVLSVLRLNKGVSNPFGNILCETFFHEQWKAVNSKTIGEEVIKLI